MSTILNNLINTILIKKLLKSGKQSKSLAIYKNLNLLLNNSSVFKEAVLQLLTPIEFKSKKIGSINYNIPSLIHYYKSINLAISWIIKAAKLRSINKTSMYKALYLESLDIVNKKGVAYKYKQEYIKKALINRVFIYLKSFKKK